jgi:hypothetical protein
MMANLREQKDFLKKKESLKTNTTWVINIRRGKGKVIDQGRSKELGLQCLYLNPLLHKDQWLKEDRKRNKIVFHKLNSNSSSSKEQIILNLLFSLLLVKILTNHRLYRINIISTITTMSILLTLKIKIKDKTHHSILAQVIQCHLAICFLALLDLIQAQRKHHQELLV